MLTGLMKFTHYYFYNYISMLKFTSIMIATFGIFINTWYKDTKATAV